MSDKDSSKLAPLEIADCKTGRRMGQIRRARGAGNRFRIKVENQAACYHVMSRTVGGEFLFDEEAKEAFRRMMWRMSRFAGVEVLTYCVMSNHFHILLRVPDRNKWLRRFEGEKGEEKFLNHLSAVYSKAFMDQLHGELAELRRNGNEKAAQELIQSFKDRLCDVSKFVKELKERFSRWYNKTHGRRGTLWMDRFKSVLVENGKALRTMAAYIDLNPVRAGLVAEGRPEDYRWCGYAEAVAGSKRARRGFCRVLEVPLDSWMLARPKASGGLRPAEMYRTLLLLEDGCVSPREIKPEEGQVMKLSHGQLLRCRVKYFSDGMAIGSRSFVDGLLRRRREALELKQERKAVVLPEYEGKTLSCLRAIRSGAVQVPE